ncbi:MAG: hypothetical protein WAW86_09390 [Gammaproteobacteria bacterium]
MKAKIAVIIGCISILAGASLSSYADGCGSRGCQPGPRQENTCPSCQCADPACGPYSHNECISTQECCEAFGNIGAR